MNIFGYVNGKYMYTSSDMNIPQFRTYELKRSVSADRNLYWSFCGYASRRDIEGGGLVRLPEGFENRANYSFQEGDI